MQAISIEGGVTAAQGFLASGMYCGIRKNKSKPDLALIYSKVPCAAAAVYTQNLVKGAPIQVTRRNIADGIAQAVICNSGNANTCNADGEQKAQMMCEAAAKALHLQPEDVVVASTGVIGQVLPIEPILEAAPKLAEMLSEDGSAAAAKAIMTTDTVVKEVAAEVVIHGKKIRMGGIAKGSGMIHPNMATMLCFLTTDANIAPAVLDQALRLAVKDSFNMVSIDGDTSTNDMTAILANGLAGNDPIEEDTEAFAVFTETLREMCGGKGRRRRNEAPGLQCDWRRFGCRCTYSGQGRDLFQSVEGGHVWCGCQLGACSLRYRLFRRAGRRGQDRRAVCLEGRDDPCVQGRRRRRFFRGRGQEDPA